MSSSRMSHSTGGGGTTLLRAAVVTVACLAAACFAARVTADIELLPGKDFATAGSLLPTTGRTSLLDPSKLDISHQMIFSYSSGLSGRSNTGGLWRTNFSYKFSNPLIVDVAVGAALSKMGTRELSTQNLFLESFSLRYRPSENFYFHFMYRDAPAGWFLSPEHSFR